MAVAAAPVRLRQGGAGEHEPVVLPAAPVRLIQGGRSRQYAVLHQPRRHDRDSQLQHHHCRQLHALHGPYQVCTTFLSTKVEHMLC